MTEPSTPWWRNRAKLPFAVFVAITAYFLWTEHEAHLIEFLPWLLVVACVGMHLFMHRRGGHGENMGGPSGNNNEEGDSR